MSNNSKNEMLRKVIWAILIIVPTILISVSMMASKEDPVANEVKETVKLVQVQTVKLVEDTLKTEVYGHVKSFNQIDLFLEVSGILVSSNFRNGESFKKGDVLVSVDPTEFETNLKSQRSNFLSQVSGVVADLKFDFEDEYPTWESYINEINFDSSLPQLPEVNNSKLKKFLSGKGIYNSYFTIKSLEEKLGKFTLIAPFDGVLSEVMVKPGTSVRPGQKLGQYVSTQEYELESFVSLSDISKVKEGATVELYSEDLHKTYYGKVSRIGKSLSKESQSIPVYLKLTSENLYDGLYLKGFVSSSVSDNIFPVDRTLLNGNSLFSITEGQLKKLEVEVISIDKDVAFVKGLKDGQVILSNAVNGAYEGMKVRFE